MRRTRTKTENDSGQDSFLDIVANIVGILIILVVVVGARTQKDWISEATAKAQQEALEKEGETTEAIRKANARVTRETKELVQLAGKTRSANEDLQFRFMERNQLLAITEEARRQLEEKRSSLGSDDQDKFRHQSELFDVRRKLDEVERERITLECRKDEPIVLRHLPTPLAKIAGDSEIHFRLSNGRIAYVPFHELEREVIADFQRNNQVSRNQPKHMGTVGPIGGFRMKYLVNFQSRAGFNSAMGRPSVRASFHPVRPDIGEKTGFALNEGSGFNKVIAAAHPHQTVVTIWTYPDSFAEFREIKNWLHNKGFATAGRPLPDGCPIGSSSDGTRSSAQ